jgi:hypothetical protein
VEKTRVNGGFGFRKKNRSNPTESEKGSIFRITVLERRVDVIAW